MDSLLKLFLLNRIFIFKIYFSCLLTMNIINSFRAFINSMTTNVNINVVVNVFWCLYVMQYFKCWRVARLIIHIFSCALFLFCFTQHSKVVCSAKWSHNINKARKWDDFQMHLYNSSSYELPKICLIVTHFFPLYF